MTDTADKRDYILDHERLQAKKLARKVIDKPKPPLWMIFVPVFFVFFAWKMKEYKNSLEDFTNSWTTTRERCLDAAYLAVGEKTELDLETLVRAATREMPDKVIEVYRKWITPLSEHYRLLLEADGGNIRELVHHRFNSKAMYLLELKGISKLESGYHQALLPTLEGDQKHLSKTIAKIVQCAAELQREQAELLFE